MNPVLLANSLMTVAQIALAIHMFSSHIPLRPRAALIAGVLGAGLVAGCLGAVWLGSRLQRGVPALLPVQVEFAPFVLPLLYFVLAITAIRATSLWNSLFCCTMGYTVQNLWVGIDRFARLTLMAAGVPGMDAFAGRLVVGLSTMAVVYHVSYLVFAKKAASQGLAFVNDRTMLVGGLLVVLFGILFNSVVSSLPHLGVPRSVTGFMALSHVVVCVLLLAFEISLPSLKRLEQEVGTIARVLEGERRQYRLSRENIQAINLKCHDLRHQIRHLQDNGRVVDGDVLADMAREITVFESTYQTGNEALDVILTEKALLASQEGIALQCIADGSALSFMAPTDIYSLFGNALEAVRRIEGDKGAVCLKVRRKRRMAAISVDNPYVGSVTFVNGLPRTTKGAERGHGFGTLSMKVLAERYGGSLSIKAEDGLYRLNVLLPLPDEAPAAEAAPEHAPSPAGARGEARGNAAAGAGGRADKNVRPRVPEPALEF